MKLLTGLDDDGHFFSIPLEDQDKIIDQLNRMDIQYLLDDQDLNPEDLLPKDTFVEHITSICQRGTLELVELDLTNTSLEGWVEAKSQEAWNKMADSDDLALNGHYWGGVYHALEGLSELFPEK